MEKQRIIVTGGSGFVGSHLCERLIELGHRVLAIDDFTTGSPKNVAHLQHHPRFQLQVHDVTRPFSFEVDRIYNLACPASPPHYQSDPVRTTLISVLGTLHCLRLAQKQGARFFQASTSEVYGDPEVHPQPEAYRGCVNPIGVRACYDEGKRCAESLAFDFQREHGVAVRVARIFNTYGPRMALDDGRVVSNFIIQALRGDDITVYGDGSQTRSFCYVDDLVSGIVRLMEHPNENGPVNLGNPSEFTIRELADKVIELTGSRSRVIHKPLPADDPRQRRPLLDRAKKSLGWEPRTSLEEGLRRTIADLRARIDIASRKLSIELMASQ